MRERPVRPGPEGVQGKGRPQPEYRRFRRTSVWLAADHLLFIKNRLFSEQYTRLYWHDVQAILLYSLRPTGSFLLGAEIVCVLVCVISAPLASHRWGTIFSGAFVVWYGLWRLSRPAWACEITTKISAVRFPLSRSLSSSRRARDELRDRVSAAQGTLEERTFDARNAGMNPGQGSLPPKKLQLIVPAAAFIMGPFSIVSNIVAVSYYVFLAAAYFVQQNFEFPFAVRSAAVMSQILAVLQLALWIISVRLVFGVLGQFNRQWEFELVRTVVGLYGLLAVYRASSDYPSARQTKTSILKLT